MIKAILRIDSFPNVLVDAGESGRVWWFEETRSGQGACAPLRRSLGLRELGVLMIVEFAGDGVCRID